jgi:hypothetical protein
MLERNGARTPGNPRLERIAWNAAAVAALAVMILVLLGSLEWLDHWAPRPMRSSRAPRADHSASEVVVPAAGAVVADRRGAGGSAGAGRVGRAVAASPRVNDASEGCVPPPRGAG